MHVAVCLIDFTVFIVLLWLIRDVNLGLMFSQFQTYVHGPQYPNKKGKTQPQHRKKQYQYCRPTLTVATINPKRDIYSNNERRSAQTFISRRLVVDRVRVTPALHMYTPRSRKKIDWHTTYQQPHPGIGSEARWCVL